MVKAIALIAKNNFIYFTSLRNAAQKRLLHVPPVLTIFRSLLLPWRSWDCVLCFGQQLVKEFIFRAVPPAANRWRSLHKTH